MSPMLGLQLHSIVFVVLSGLMSNWGSSLNIECKDISIWCNSAIALIPISGGFMVPLFRVVSFGR